jgi:hypothetical protein
MDGIGIYVGVFIFWAVVVGLLAKRKNRSGTLWGIVGGLSWVIALLILAFLSYLCPKCKKKLTNIEAKQHLCPDCGDFKSNSPIAATTHHESTDSFNSIAEDIVKTALEYRLQYTSTNSRVSAEIGAETLFFLLHVFDRVAYQILGAESRDDSFDLISAVAINDYASAILSKDAPIDLKKGVIKQFYIDLNNRQNIYGQCASVVGEGFPSAGSCIFALSFYINKAQGNATLDDVDNILTGSEDVSNENLEFFPDISEVISLAVEMGSDLKDLNFSSKLAKI